MCQEIKKMMKAFWLKTDSSSSKGIRWLAGNKMSMSKTRGDLGIHDLFGFKLTLLKKQCWNLIDKPDALVSRLFKTHYYPDCHFLQARKLGVQFTLGQGYVKQKKRSKRVFVGCLGWPVNLYKV